VRKRTSESRPLTGVALYVVAMLSKLVWGTFYLARGDLWREVKGNLVA